MILAPVFTLSADDDYERLAAAGGRLRAILDALIEGRIPEPGYDDETLLTYLRSVVAKQRDDGTWSVSINPQDLDEDSRTDAWRFVTWSAMALICRVAMTRKDLVNQLEGWKDSLQKGMASPIARDFTFPESGEAALVQQVEAALILAGGRIPAFLEGQQVHDSDFAHSLAELIDGFEKRLESGDTVLPGGVDYRPFLSLAHQSLMGDALSGEK